MVGVQRYISSGKSHILLESKEPSLPCTLPIIQTPKHLSLKISSKGSTILYISTISSPLQYSQSPPQTPTLFTMSIGRVVSTTLTSTISKGGRTIQVAYVKQTDIWTRSFIDPGVQRKFTALVEENIDTFSSDTTVVALQYVSPNYFTFNIFCLCFLFEIFI